MIVESLILALNISPIVPHPNGRELAYYPQALARVFKLHLGIDLDPQYNSGSYQQKYDNAEVLAKIPGLDEDSVADLAATLLVSWVQQTKRGQTS